MARSCYKPFAFAAVIVLLTAAAAGAFQLIAPTEGQAVRENVKIELPASAVPDDGFISVLVGDAPDQQFVVALSRDAAKAVGGDLVFYWNSKAPNLRPQGSDDVRSISRTAGIR